jgi:hypothetical protein
MVCAPGTVLTGASLTASMLMVMSTSVAVPEPVPWSSVVTVW